MTTAKKKGLNNPKVKFDDFAEYKEVNLPMAMKVSEIDTILQIPEGCKQVFKAKEFKSKAGVYQILHRLAIKLGYEAYKVLDVPGTNGTEYCIIHIAEPAKK